MMTDDDEGFAMSNLEHATSRWEWLRSGRRFPRWQAGDAEELGLLLAVARAFPKTLKALERALEGEYANKIHPDVEAQMESALRAAREAVKP